MLRKTKFIWMDGNFVKWDDAKVHVLTHALHYGSAIFEGIHSYRTGKGAAIFRLKDHVDRMFFSAGSMHMKLSFTKKQIMDAIRETVRINNMEDAYIRPLAYYAYGNVGVFPKDVPTSVSILTIPWEHYYSKDLRIATSSFRRHSEKSSIYGAKISGNYANSILAMYEARKKGYDEALMLDSKGYVAEGPAENIFIVKDESLITPSSHSALPGITRDSITKISADIGIRSHEKKVRLYDVKNADELFFCGTATEVAPIISVDGKRIGNGKAGKITSLIRGSYRDVVRGKDKRYGKWLYYA